MRNDMMMSVEKPAFGVAHPTVIPGKLRRARDGNATCWLRCQRC